MISFFLEGDFVTWHLYCRIYYKVIHMKAISLYIVLICFCAFAKAQNETPEEVVDTVEIKLGVGERQEIKTIEVTFLEVIEDSRCPKDVECVWAGQAKIKIRVKEKGKESIEKEIVFNASGKSLYVHKTETVVIKAMRLSPYPETSLAVNKRVYYLELQA